MIQPPIEPSHPERDTPEALCPVCAQPSGGRCLGHADCPLGAAPVASTDASGGRVMTYESAPADVELWVVYGPDCFPTVFLGKFKDYPNGARALWGFSIYEGEPGFRTLGVGEEWAKHKNLLAFQTRRAAFEHIASLFPPHAPQPDDEGSREAHPIAVSPVVREALERIRDLTADRISATMVGVHSLADKALSALEVKP